jgi:hypothetical protein
MNLPTVSSHGSCGVVSTASRPSFMTALLHTAKRRRSPSHLRSGCHCRDRCISPDLTSRMSPQPLPRTAWARCTCAGRSVRHPQSSSVSTGAADLLVAFQLAQRRVDRSARKSDRLHHGVAIDSTSRDGLKGSRPSSGRVLVGPRMTSEFGRGAIGLCQ